MDSKQVIALAEQAGIIPWVKHEWSKNKFIHTDEGMDGDAACLVQFASLIEARLKEQGYRQCAKGQRTTQWCGMVEQAVLAEREACAEIAKQWDIDHPSTNYGGCIAAAIRSRA